MLEIGGGRMHGSGAASEASDMQVTETSADGLEARAQGRRRRRASSAERFTTRLDEVKDKVQLKGFRKGKVPVAHIKKLYGRSVMAEVLQQAVEETSRKALADRKERPAHQPNINLTEDKDEIERVLTGQSDLAFTMSYEALPEIKHHRSGRAASSSARWPTSPTRRSTRRVADLAERSVRYEVGGGPRRRRRRPAHHRLRRQHRRRASSRAARARTCSW